ncbi:MAG: indole-3-glycerol phosphate synthase TrpC [Verrucomicrobiota bacterium]
MKENILRKITEERRLDVERLRKDVSPESLAEACEDRTYRSMANALTGSNGPGIIAEVKKASPSAGILVEDYRPEEIASGYETAGACAVSVLTEPRYFKGSGEHLRRVREATNLPVLRKDFICHEYQVLEAAAWGADIVLLIVAALERADLNRLNEYALELGLETLVETHTVEEIEAALSLQGAIIGVNSRNLKTLETDLAVAENMAAAVPCDKVSVAESGIKSAFDISRLSRLGYNGFLIGEMLLAESNPVDELKLLIRGLDATDAVQDED